MVGNGLWDEDIARWCLRWDLRKLIRMAGNSYIVRFAEQHGCSIKLAGILILMDFQEAE